jgi:pyridoxamine 5'-phosphate oxidase
MTLESLRRQYLLSGLSESDLRPDPIEQFQDWLQIALDSAPADWVEPYAATLATSDSKGRVSGRVVLLRDVDVRGFVFYTNYDSLKGRQLAENAQAALVFYWGYLERQVRVEGRVTKIDRQRAEDYFHRRPRGSQLSAAISPQSAVVTSRAALEQQAAELDARLGTAQVPLPDNWGGYCVQPQQIEFWQGRENRLHDRLQYELAGGQWIVRRLAP